MDTVYKGHSSCPAAPPDCMLRVLLHATPCPPCVLLLRPWFIGLFLNGNLQNRLNTAVLDLSRELEAWFQDLQSVACVFTHRSVQFGT